MYIKQYIARNKKLVMIGMTYSEYLSSVHWMRVKEAARKKERFRSCFICGATEDLQLHHTSYQKIHRLDQVGIQLTYLVALCGFHHLKVHEWAKRKRIGLKAAVRQLKKRFKGKSHPISM